jgi:pilus assembly protein CpaC
MFKHNQSKYLGLQLVAFSLLGLAVTATRSPGQDAPGGRQDAPTATPARPSPPAGSPVHRVQATRDRMEMTVSTSCILTLDQKIPQVQVNNPDILELVPLSPTQVQVSAKRSGVTQVNLWGEDKRIFTIDVTVFGDARELSAILHAQFPKTALSIVPAGSAVIVSGYVDHPEHISRIVQIAEQYYPKVINNMTVSGVQQVLLHVKVMEVSRTKLRALGFDFSTKIGKTTLVSGIGGLISMAGGAINDGATLVVDNGSQFFGVLEALRQEDLMKILAEPNLVAVSGRPSYFLVGGELGYLVPGGGGVGTTTVAFKEYGTRIDFVPIVLGNGRIRLEVRPSVSEKDMANSPKKVTDGPPALKTRVVETGVEMRAGQTLAIAGFVYTRTEAQNVGIPWLSEVPYLGVPFRRVQEDVNEVELLVLITPELVEAMDAHEVPPCGPGMQTTSPPDCDLFWKGMLEVPKCCPGCGGVGCAACGQSGQAAAGPQAGAAAQAAGPRNRYAPSNPNAAPAATAANGRKGEPGIVGPVGYDVVN